MLDRPVSWFRSLNPTVLDGLLALVLLVSEVYRQNQLATPEPEQLATLLFIFAPLTLRRRWPIAVTWLIGGALLANLVLGFENSFFDNFAIVVAFYTVVANSASNLRLTLTIGFALVGINAGIALGWYNQRSVNLADLPYNWLLFALPVVLGYSVRTRRAYSEQLVERNGLLARQVASEERTRIARELHDVIAHSVSVMVLQATAGARVAARDPSQALQSFEVIQQTGRDALSELRRALGVLRGAGE
ncbi:MAG TPA: histidine kinase dimerization/phosphoacceptor domain-containing protein, partial [Candidatus Dormibacteraeota bacterium]|nr:histidine kinase dimerization/phosphoacceptor domain-containing protein [Candidatus Dormibacteraeota bacterium]